MQPYFFPYIGYYQLVHAVDTFVSYDDVNYIKGGWINRNRILINGRPAYITVSLEGASPNRLIRDIAIVNDRTKLLRTIEQVYRKAPFFSEAMVPIADVLTRPVRHIGELAMNSVVAVMDHLGFQRDYRVSGDDFRDTKGMPRADRLITITKACGSSHYINAIGGRELYDKGYFRDHGVKLDLLEPVLTEYRQFEAPFIPGLSIIDVLMFNSQDMTRSMIDAQRPPLSIPA